LWACPVLTTMYVASLQKAYPSKGIPGEHRVVLYSANAAF